MPGIFIRPLQLNILFLGPDQPYFSRIVLLVLRSEVIGLITFWACAVSIFEKMFDYGSELWSVNWFIFIYKPTYRPYPEVRPARETEY